MGDDATQPAPWQRRFWYAALTALALVVLVGVVAGAVLLVVEAAAFLQPLLIPVVAAVILTYLLGPVVDKICSFGIGRMWSVLLLFLFIGLGFASIGLWVGPLLWHQTTQFGATLPEQASRGQELMLATLEWVRELQQKLQPASVLGEERTIRDELWSWAAGYVEGLIAWFEERLPEILGAVGSFLQRSLGGFLGVAGVAVSLFLVPLFLFFFLKDSAQFAKEWRQYIPTTRNLVAMIRYYLTGIFTHAEHPFRQTQLTKHNPLQRLAYLFVQVVINPTIWISGLLYMYYSDWAEWGLGGLDLALVAFVHLAAAFMMVIFLIVHIYFGTTGHTPMSHFKAMITGYEDTEE